MVSELVGRLEARLPRDVYVLQTGLVLNAFGNGLANPFVLLYLHDVRHIPLPEAGLASAASAAAALLASLVGGRVADAIGAKPSVLAGLALAASTFLIYPFVTTAPAAILCGASLGLAAGGWLTGQSILLAAIVPPAKRHIAFAQQRVAANIGLGLGGLCGGLIASTTDARTFSVIFLANAATFLVYGLFVARLRSPHDRHARGGAGGYRSLVRDRLLVRILAIDLALVAGAVALLNGLLPLYVRNTVHAGESTIGSLFLVNSLLVVGFQLPVARALEGRRRARAFVAIAGLFACCWSLTAAAAAWGPALLFAAVVVFSFGECIYDSVRTPLIADLAPRGLQGRYVASAAFSWQLGFIVGPSLGAVLLSMEPVALWAVAAGVCVLAGLGSVGLDRRLPETVRRTPQREPVRGG